MRSTSAHCPRNGRENRSIDPRRASGSERRTGLRAPALALFSFLVTTTALPTDAHASTQVIDEARELLSRAQTKYAKGDYEAAASHFLAAWERHPIPGLLFNIAQAFRLAGRHEDAREWYERFLREDPDTPNRREVEMRIDQLTLVIERNGPTPTRGLLDSGTAHVDPPRGLEPPASGEQATSSAPITALSQTSATKGPDAQVTRVVDASEAKPTNTSNPSGNDAWWDTGVDVSTPSTTAAPKWLDHLPLMLAGTAAAFAVGGAVSYAVAHSRWSDAMSEERARARVDDRIRAGDTAHAVSLGLGGTAVVIGAGAAISLAF